jgi:AraC-like DNA-binding protein
VAEPGDVILMLAHGRSCVRADTAAEPEAADRILSFRQWRARADLAPPPDPAAGGSEVTEIVCGKYRLDAPGLHPLLSSLPGIVVVPRALRDAPDLARVLHLLISESARGQIGSAIAVTHLLDLLLIHLVCAAVRLASPTPRVTAFDDPVAARALEALHSDLAAPWTSERLAARVGVSRATLARRFASTVGRAPMAYLTWLRLNRAAELLRDGSGSLAVIADAVGYGMPYALSHAFARQFGTRPGRYRRRGVAHATSPAPSGTGDVGAQPVPAGVSAGRVTS